MTFTTSDSNGNNIEVRDVRDLGAVHPDLEGYLGDPAGVTLWADGTGCWIGHHLRAHNGTVVVGDHTAVHFNNCPCPVCTA